MILRSSVWYCLFLLLTGTNPLEGQQPDTRHLVSLIFKDSFEGWKRESREKVERLKSVIASKDFKTNCLTESAKLSGSAVGDFHWVDLNRDSFTDIIFSGTCMPYTATGLFLFKNGKYVRVDNMAGAVIDIKHEAHGTTVFVRNEACCCSFFNAIYVAKILPGSFNPEKWELLWHGDMEMDTLAFDFEYFETTKTIALRNQPRMLNKKSLWECNEDYKVLGNITFQFHKGVSGYILHRKKRRGKTWGLALILPNDRNIENGYITERYFVPGQTFSLGWLEINGSIRLMPEP